MALLPSGYIYSTTNNHGVATEQIGGVAIGLSTQTNTAAGNPITYAFLVKDQAIVRGRTTPIQKTSAGSYNATVNTSGGTFAYNQTRTDWTVLRMGTTINGVASGALLNPASGSTMARRSLKLRAFGAKTSSAFRAGYYQMYGISGQRTPWTTAPSGQTGIFVHTTGNTVIADDQAIFVTYMSVPGELVYIQDGKTVKLDDYKARTNS